MHQFLKDSPKTGMLSAVHPHALSLNLHNISPVCGSVEPVSNERPVIVQEKLAIEICVQILGRTDGLDRHLKRWTPNYPIGLSDSDLCGW